MSGPQGPIRRNRGSRRRVKVSNPARNRPNTGHPGSSHPASRPGRRPSGNSRPGRRPRTRPLNTGSTSSRPRSTTRRPSRSRSPRATRSKTSTAARPASTVSRPVRSARPARPIPATGAVRAARSVRPTGQYGQPGQYGQYPGPYGQPPAGPKRSRAVIGTVVGVFAAILVAVVLVLGFWQPGFFVTTKLDVSKAQAGVQQILTDDTNGYGAKNVKDVKCNNGQNPTVKKGSSFDCDVSIDGTKRQVTVTFQDNKGTYEVGRPK